MTKSQLNKRLTACKKILKISKNIGRENFSYAYTINDTQYICNGYSIVGLTDYLPLAENPTDEIPDFAFEQQLNNIGKDAKTAVEMPDPKKLKEYIKQSKDNNECARYNFGENLPCVNAEYLLNMMTIFPNVTAHINNEFSNYGALYFEDTNGNKGGLMPLRKPKEDTEKTDLDRFNAEN